MPRKREKNFSPEFCSYPTRARKFQRKKQKNQKIKKSLFSIIFIQNGRRQAKKERKIFQSRISFILGPGKKIPKKNNKKIQKIKKPHSDIISIHTVMRQAEKKRKKFYSRSPFLTDSGQKIPKKKKIAKKLKNIFPALFLSKPG